MENNMELNPEVIGQIDTLKALSLKPVVTPDDFVLAGETIVRVADVRKKVVEFFRDIKEAAFQAHKKICNKEKSYTDQLDEIRRNFDFGISKYQTEKRKREEEEQKKLREEAERKAREEQERILAQAQKAVDNGKTEKADVLIEKAASVQAVVPIIPRTLPPKVQGFSTTETWAAVVTDPLLVPAYFNGIEIREIKQSALDKLAKMSDGKLNIPGVKCEKRFGTAARGVH